MKRICILTLVFLLVQSWAANAQESAPEITLAMPNPASLDPVSLSRFDLAGRDLTENLFIGLTRLNARRGEIEPWLAESWEVSADGLVWTFKLRSDVQWVSKDLLSGEPVALRPVVAGDVVYAIDRACDPLRPSPVSANLFIIVGCRAYVTNNSLQTPSLDSLGVKALDDTTLEIRLLYPASYFLTLTSLPEMRPVPAEYINDAVGEWFIPSNTITSGAWLVESWNVGADMRLVQNPFWVEAGALAAVNIRFNISLENLGAELEAGTLSATRIDPLLLATDSRLGPFLKSSDGRTLLMVGFSFNNLTLDNQPISSPLDNPAVRRALALGLDRTALAGAVYGEKAQGADRFIPRTAIAAPSVSGANFDPTAAQALLASAGFPNCSGMGQIPLAVSFDPTETLLAQNVVSQWSLNLGCSTDVFPIVQAERTRILESARNAIDLQDSSAPPRYPLWIIKWTADYPDAQAWVGDALHCEDGYFRTGRQCSTTDQVMEQAGILGDITARFTAYNQVETDLFGSQGNFPVIPLVLEKNWWAQQPELTGVASYGAWQFDRWRVE